MVMTEGTPEGYNVITEENIGSIAAGNCSLLSGPILVQMGTICWQDYWFILTHLCFAILALIGVILIFVMKMRILYVGRTECSFKLLLAISMMVSLTIGVVTFISWGLNTMEILNLSSLMIKVENKMLYRLSKNISAFVVIGTTMYEITGDLLVFVVFDAASNATILYNLQGKRSYAVTVFAALSVLVSFTMGLCSFVLMDQVETVGLGLRLYGLGSLVSAIVSVSICAHLTRMKHLPAQIKHIIIVLAVSKCFDFISGSMLLVTSGEEVICELDSFFYVKAPYDSFYHGLAMIITCFSGITSITTIFLLHLPELSLSGLIGGRSGEIEEISDFSGTGNASLRRAISNKVKKESLPRTGASLHKISEKACGSGTHSTSDSLSLELERVESCTVEVMTHVI